MGEFRSIACISDVHIADILAERMADVLGPGWPSLRLAGDAWAYVDGARALGVGGIEPVWQGRYVLWSYEAGLSLGDWKRVLRFTRLRIDRAFQDPAVRRIEATGAIDSPRFCRFLQRLGFECEGRLQAYAPTGATMDMFARVRP
ncbi:hypothetical protein [Hyphomonas sp.]|jgi:hypothetical protein|uniref:hypothetical protein n=1 Tax=Hyphomonas sp. TaxID=87 RepID=UPI0032EFCACF